MAAEAAWVNVIIALMAFIAAAVAVAATLNIYGAQQYTLELQRKQFEEQQRQARREQAAKVSFFVDVNNDQQFQLKVINASDYPILGVIAVLQPRTPNAVAVALTPNLLPTGPTPYTITWRRSVLPLGFADLKAERAVVFGIELWFEDSNAGERPCRVVARVDDEHVAPRKVQPRRDDDLRARLQPLPVGGEFRSDGHSCIRCALVALPRRGGDVGQRRLDPPDRPHVEPAHVPRPEGRFRNPSAPRPLRVCPRLPIIPGAGTRRYRRSDPADRLARGWTRPMTLPSKFGGSRGGRARRRVAPATRQPLLLPRILTAGPWLGAWAEEV